MHGSLRNAVCLVAAVTVLVAGLSSNTLWPDKARAHDNPNRVPAGSGTSNRQAPAFADEPQGTLVRAITTEPNSLDLPQTTEMQAFTTAWQMYDSLLRVDDDGWIVPALAESWEVSGDSTEYTFYLRSGVIFHNGEPFTADAVVYSWQRASTGGFVNSHYWQRASLVEKLGDYLVRITTDEPDPFFLRIVADQWAMVPPGYFQEVGQQGFEANPVGTGPFVFVEWVANDHITLQANPDYWQAGLPKLETLIFRPIADPADRVTALQNGEVDVITRLDSEQAQSLLGIEGIEVIHYPVPRIYYIAFNNLTTGVGEPTEDAMVRQAMNYAVDVDTIIDTWFDGYAEPATGYVSSSELGYDNAAPFGFDPNRAVQLLSDAGYPAGFEMDMACPIGAYRNFEEVCQSVADDLDAVGVAVDLQFIEAGTFWDLEANKQLPPLFGDSWSSNLGEAYLRLYGALGGWDTSYSAWFDPVMDQYLDAIAVELDQEQRAALYEQLQAYMRADPPFIYLYEPFVFEAIDVQVQGYKPRADEHCFLMETWLDLDGDGVLESVEDGAPNGGDGNQDGIPDRDQGNVASLPNAADGRYHTLESPEGTQLSNVQALGNPSPVDAPTEAEFPLGFVAFEVDGVDPGGSVPVTLYLPLESDINSYWRYGRTPDDRSKHWYRFYYDGSTGAEIVHELDRTLVYLHYVDDARGDNDLIANGRIANAGAPASTVYTAHLPLVLRSD